MSFSEDSAIVAFTIVREGFETKEKRKKAKKEWGQQKSRIQISPQFYYRFLSNTKPEKLNSINEVDSCSAWVGLGQYRMQDFKYPAGVGGSKVYLIQKLQDGRYLKWNAILMANK